MENASGQADIEYPATALMRPPDFFDYDYIVEHMHDSEDAFKAFFARMMLDEEVTATLAADEAVFLDREKTRVVVVAHVVETRGVICTFGFKHRAVPAGGKRTRRFHVRMTGADLVAI